MLLISLGANYRPCANVTLRPEFRMDEFNGVTLQDDSSFAIDAIFTF